MIQNKVKAMKFNLKLPSIRTTTISRIITIVVIRTRMQKTKVQIGSASL
jgi:hypothetical protein